MDQIKIGNFISSMRKEKGLTQHKLASVLGVSDKAVSKWECGNGIPDVSLMLPICKALDINLNELFSGERLSDEEYKARAEENLIALIRESNQAKKNIVGANNLGRAEKVKLNAAAVHKTNNEFWSTIGSEFLGATALPGWGGFLPSEDKLNLLEDLKNKNVLELGCGNGHSLCYVSDRGATDLWGLDISANQIERTKETLAEQKIKAHLICSPMEKECGIPSGYFDVIFSVYGIGWSTDLNKTFELINSYLKTGGIFVFGWSHPIHKCVSFENGSLFFSNSYFDESWYRADMSDRKIMLSNRMISTYINALSDNGFIIEKLVEETDKEKALASNDPFGKKALMLPTAFVIKARKK